MQRRQFSTGLALALSGILPVTCAASRPPAASPNDAHWRAIEGSVAGRLGVAVLDTASGRIDGHRLDERFPMCSTFKWLAAALVLRRVDQGVEQLERRVRFGREALLANSSESEKHLADGMTIGQMCEAAVTISDNAAANLLLSSFGGPPAVTRFARTLGDTMTRLDRTEPTLNESRLGDPRDTTTPRAMSIGLNAALLGAGLSPRGRAQLLQWLQATTTGDERLRAGVPADWKVGDKTGTGAHGSTNDVAILMPPGRAPVVIAAYLTQTRAPLSERNKALAEVGREVAAMLA